MTGVVILHYWTIQSVCLFCCLCFAMQTPAVPLQNNSTASPETALMCNLPRHIPYLSHLCEHQL